MDDPQSLKSLTWNIIGITVCLPSPAPCLKEIAKQISDRDNAVRNAALNCAVQAYYIIGDKIFKMVGQVIFVEFLRWSIDIVL